MSNTGSARPVLIESDTEALGQRRRTGRGHVDSYGEGRVCASSGCTTQLSRYNSGFLCALHDTVKASAGHWTR